MNGNNYEQELNKIQKQIEELYNRMVEDIDSPLYQNKNLDLAMSDLNRAAKDAAESIEEAN